ncbi:MAG: OsmC family protein [Candidatus Acidiferrum sp.]
MSNSTSIPVASTKTPAANVVVRGSASGFLQEVTVGKYTLRVDEPLSAGGTESAPDPYDYLLTALGSCTSMTVGWYARHHKIPLEDITVSLRHSRIHAQDCAECATKNGLLDRIDLDVQLIGPITPEQHAKLMEIAGKCPVHRTLKSEIDIQLHAAPSR